MPPSLALVLTVAFCSVLLWGDRRVSPSSRGLWLPILWIFIIGSRFPTQWMEVLGFPGMGGGAVEDGSPVDAVFFLLMTAMGMAVLSRRGASLSTVVRNNLWLTVFFLYSFVAIGWSDFPLVALKRWVKILGHPVMALIVLTDARPLAALSTVLRRAAFLMVPLSIMFIKYFPQYGRTFHPWSGEAANRGIGLTKNDLGYTCMVFGLFFVWRMLTDGEDDAAKSRRRQRLVLNAAFLWMIWWLTTMADSATSLAGILLGAAVMAAIRFRLIHRRFVAISAVCILLLVGSAEAVFGVYDRTIGLLGRDPTLTDRTLVWRDLLAFDVNPVIGAGFESFWLGDRLAAIWQKWWWRPIQAHNGYLETYLNLGWIGVGILCCLLLATFRQACRDIASDLPRGLLRLGFLVAIIAYNYTEAAFKGVSLVWTVFHFIAIDYRLGSAVTVPVFAAGRNDEPGDLAVAVTAPAAPPPLFNARRRALARRRRRRGQFVHNHFRT